MIRYPRIIPFGGIPFLRIAPRRAVDRAVRQIASQKLRDAPVLQDGLHSPWPQIKVQAVLSGGWILVVYGYGVWFGFRRWCPIYSCVEGAVQPSYVRVLEPVE